MRQSRSRGAPRRQHKPTLIFIPNVIPDTKLNDRVGLKRAIKNYLSYVYQERSQSQRYLLELRWILFNFSKRVGDKQRVALITPDRVRRFLVREYIRLGRVTYSHRTQVLYKFFDYCVSKKLQPFNPIIVFKTRFTNHKPTFFTMAQLDAIFSMLPPGETRDACLIMYHTGIKKTELLDIVGPDHLRGELILKDRRITCPPHILKILDTRKYFYVYRLRRDLQSRLIKRGDFRLGIDGLRNSYIIRQIFAGTPIEVLARQTGMSLRGAETRANRLLHVSKALRAEMWSQPFKDYV